MGYLEGDIRAALPCRVQQPFGERECQGQKYKKFPKKPHRQKKKKNQEARAAQDTSGCIWMHMGQRAAHSTGTTIPRGTKTLVGGMLVGRSESRSKGKITESCCGQREAAPLPLRRLKRKWLQKCWVKLSQKEIKAC